MGCEALMIDYERHYITVSLENKQLTRTEEKNKKPFTFIKQSNLLLCLLKRSVCTSSSGDTVSEMGYLDSGREKCKSKYDEAHSQDFMQGIQSSID